MEPGKTTLFDVYVKLNFRTYDSRSTEPRNNIPSPADSPENFGESDFFT